MGLLTILNFRGNNNFGTILNLRDIFLRMLLLFRSLWNMDIWPFILIDFAFFVAFDNKFGSRMANFKSFRCLVDC
jgi:hypothetical protein